MKKLSILKNRILSIILGLTMVLSILGGFHSLAEEIPEEPARAPMDITHLVEYKVWNFSVKRNGTFEKVVENGKVLASPPPIYKSNTVRIEYSWKISKGNMRQVKKGDHFKIKLPDQNIIKNPEITSDIFDDKQEKIGTFTIKGDDLTATLTGDFSKTSALENGILGAYGEVKEIQENFELFKPHDNSGSITIKIENHPGSGDVGHDPEEFPEKPSKYHITKWGRYVETDNELHFAITINNLVVSDIYKPDAAALIESKRKENVYVIDELPADLKVAIRSGAFFMAIPFWAPAYKNGSTTELSDEASVKEPIITYRTELVESGSSKELWVGKEGTSTRKRMFVVDEVGTEKTWEAYQEDIKGKSEPTIGIWNGEKIIVNFKTLPMNGITYDDLYGGTERLKKEIDKAKNFKNKKVKISEAQAEKMKNAYSGKDIIAMHFEFRTKIIGSPKKEYINTAYMHYDTKEVKDGSYKVKVDNAYGSVQQKPFEGKIKVKKKWIGQKGNPVTVKVYANNNGGVEYTHILNEPSWEHEFTSLPEYNEAGQTIQYEVTETPIPDGYSMFVKKHETDWEYMVTNIEQRDLTVTKKWLDTNDTEIQDTDSSLPEVTVSVYKKKNEKETKVDGKTVKLNAMNHWTHTFTHLDKYDGDGELIEYIVKEDTVPVGFTATGKAEGDTYTITNKKEGISLAVTKKWKSINNTDMTEAPVESISVDLYKTIGTQLKEKVTTVELKKPEWKYTFTNLDKYTNGGEEIKYSVEEKKVDGFLSAVEPSQTGNEIVITNTKVSVELVIKKEWKNSQGGELTAPPIDKIKALIFKTGEGITKEKVAELEIKAENNWENKIVLPKYEGDKLINYVVEEEKPLSSYEVTVKVENGKYMIENKKRPFIPPYEPPTTPSDPPSTPPDDPQTPPSEPPTPPTTPNEPPTPSIPPIPPIPSLPPELPNEEPPEIPIVVTEDEIPEGDIPPVPPVIPQESFEEDIIVDGDDTPRGNTDIPPDKKSKKKILAKTGGLVVRFKFAVLGFGVLLLSLMCLEFYRRKRKNKL